MNSLEGCGFNHKYGHPISYDIVKEDIINIFKFKDIGDYRNRYFLEINMIKKEYGILSRSVNILDIRKEKIEKIRNESI